MQAETPIDPINQGQGRLSSLIENNEPQKIGKAYSRFVNSMRWILPLTALVLMAIVLTWPEMDNQIKVIEEDSLAAIGLPSVGSNELLNPRYETIDKNNNPVNIEASKALQSSQNESMIRLENPKADLKTSQGNPLKVKAEQGVYDRDREKLFLQDNVKINHAYDYEMDAKELRINLKTNEAQSDQEVTITGSDAILNAQGMDGKMDEGTLFFEGPATLILKPKSSDNRETE
ncbi:MAG: LPS export ABC transporter periplasmic protein LptC [Pseudomonadota bacterium]